MLNIIKYIGITLILIIATLCLSAEPAKEKNKTPQPSQQEINDKKIEAYRQKLITNPNDIETHRAYQNFMRQWGGLNDLKEEYLLKMNAEPLTPLYYYLYGRLAEGKELEDSFKRAMELEVKSPNPELRFWLYFGFGQFYLDTKKYKEALQYLEMASKLRPDSLDVLHQMALVHYEMDNITEAMKIWDKILQVKNDYLDAFLGKALIYKSRGMYDNAIKELENILKADVALWRAYEPLIQCYHAKQDYKKGEELISVIRQIYKVTKDSELKKNYELITIDIVTFNKKVFIVEEAIIPPPLPPGGEGNVCEYYFRQLKTQNDKNPQLVYTAAVHYNLLAAMREKDTSGLNLYNLIITGDIEVLKKNPYAQKPLYQEILSAIKIIEEGK